MTQVVGPLLRLGQAGVAVDDDVGRDVELTSGLIGGEDLIVNPPDSLQAGDKVKIADANSSEEHS